MWTPPEINKVYDEEAWNTRLAVILPMKAYRNWQDMKEENDCQKHEKGSPGQCA